MVANSYLELSETSNVSIIVVKDDDAVAAVQNFTGTIGTVESVKQSTVSKADCQTDEADHWRMASLVMTLRNPVHRH